ncbi:MAG: efflux RND transporter periplasmic adaptor subunit [Gallionella sp.]|jgi:RND family efflux transporter MFP subunit|nr:efflux RND transporter periplasmic adaptor subunit [Gallionella sp.]
MMSEKIPHAPSSRNLRLAGLVFAAVAVVIAAVGILIRTHQEHGLEKEVESRHTTVKIVNPEFGPSSQSLVLPGDVRAYVDAPMYARVSGYMKAWYTDIGAHVKKGQLLGEIDTPELDEQILRAQSDVAVANSNWEMAEVTAKRWNNLLTTNSVSRQETDEKTADAKAKKDILNAARSSLKALEAEQSFKRIVAPFDGIVTERNTDIGQLISASNSKDSGNPLFRVVQNQKLRVFVEVPQSYAKMIKMGMKVTVELQERPGEPFDATVIASSDAIHENSRTSTIELLMDNKNNAVFSGSYAEIHFNLPSQSNVFRVPVSALIFRRNGLEVATVGPDNRVLLKHIVIARDLGRVVEVASGLDSTDRIIDSPSDSITQGDLVRIQAPEAPPTGGKAGAAS